MSDTLVVSNSHVSQWLTCKRQFWYSSVRKLQPKRKPQAINRGLFGHALLETWYRTKNQANLNDAMIEAINNNLDLKVATPIFQLVQKYLHHYEYEIHNQIYEVELRHEIPLTMDIRFSYKPDLIFRLPSGTLVVVDHKFVYDFYDTDILFSQPQIPKYISALRYEGIDVQYGMINQIRTRPGAVDIFNRTVLDPDSYELNNIWEEHIKAADEIAEFTSNPPAIVPRVNNTMICKGCMFRELCRYELKGMNTDLLLEEQYEPSDYDISNGSDQTKGSVTI